MLRLTSRASSKLPNLHGPAVAGQGWKLEAAAAIDSLSRIAGPVEPSCGSARQEVQPARSLTTRTARGSSAPTCTWAASSGPTFGSALLQRRLFSNDSGKDVLVVESDAHFRQLVDEHKAEGKPIVIDFYAVWCGPCRQISPYFEELSSQYKGQMSFIKVDVDKLQSAAAEASINAVPAFQVWRDGVMVDEFVGASKQDLKALCDKHAATS